MSNEFCQKVRIDGLDLNGILFTNVMYKFLDRVVKNGILLMENMSKYSVTFLCMLLMVFGNFMMSSLTCTVLVRVVVPLRYEILGP